MATLVIESDWIVPVESPSIRGGFVVVSNGRICHVGDRLPERFRDSPRVSLSNGAILPGLINSHCHLELSDYSKPLEVPDHGNASGSMVGWLANVMARRMAIRDSGADIEGLKRASTVSGVRESWACGTRLVVDNITAPWSSQWCDSAARDLLQGARSDATMALVPESPIYLLPCIELVDVTQTRMEQTWTFSQQVHNLLDATNPLGSDPTCRSPMGLAPHAPYTASKRIVERAVHSSRAQHGWISMHLAESPEELEYVDLRQGPFKDWISPWIDGEHASEIGTIQEHLQLLSGSTRALVVHGNYLRESHIDFLSTHRQNMAVVYCPRTHRHFRHSEHPTRQLVKGHVPLFLGTDSKASNPNLSVFEEWQTACKSFPDLAPSFWMAACTTAPANFLGVQDWVGTLRLGSKSLLTCVPIEAQSPTTEEELWQALLEAKRAFPLECHDRFFAYDSTPR